MSFRTPRQISAAKTIANILLETKAVNFRPEEPYILTAGWASPVYIDCRWLISFPYARKTVTLLAKEEIEQSLGKDKLGSIAGGETAGIPYAAWLADSLSLPMQYIRKKPKGFGRMAQIEGQLIEGTKALLVEDLATDGGSKMSFVDALRNAGAICNHAFVVFFYNAFPNALTDLEDENVSLLYLCTWADVLEVAQSKNYFSQGKINGVKEFLEDPVLWSKNNGGK
jgi:orotate phosphoribosyltransferase